MAPSLWRRPGTKTFQLVHRSQRDPLINDPTASDRVLKAVDKRQKVCTRPRPFHLAMLVPADDPELACTASLPVSHPPGHHSVSLP